MLVQARAKINLSLCVTGRREDGYHLLDTLMHTVSLCDDIELQPANNLMLSGDLAGAPGEKNLAFRAARLLQDATGCETGAHIALTKRIPAGAGLGGGSADAAAVLVGLNALWGTGLSDTALAQLGLALGADVPFLLRGGFARATGVGEVLQPLPPLHGQVLLAMGPTPLATPAVYAAFAAGRPPMWSGSAGADPGISASWRNDLTEAACSLSGEVTQGMALIAPGAKVCLMTGSGACVYAWFPDGGARLPALPEGWWGTVCELC